MSDFATELTRLMDEKGITRDELAQRTGISAYTIYKYRSGVYLPRKPKIERIEKALGVTPGTLMKEAENGPVKKTKVTRNEREQIILKAWKRGERTPYEVAEITGYSLSAIGEYLPLRMEA